MVAMPTHPVREKETLFSAVLSATTDAGPKRGDLTVSKGAELVLVGFNTNGKADDIYKPRRPISVEDARKEALFHHRLAMEYKFVCELLLLDLGG